MEYVILLSKESSLEGVKFRCILALKHGVLSVASRFLPLISLLRVANAFQNIRAYLSKEKLLKMDANDK